MFKFNSNHIITGQIKQVLNAFNLPSYKVYTAEHYNYFLKNGIESPELSDGLYIKHDVIKEYKNGKWEKDLDTYTYNNKYLNLTKNLPINNNIYDYTTHEYLGNFLRFQRDYLGLDLMPLYNCFSNKVCNNLKLSIERPKITGTQISYETDEAGNTYPKAVHTYTTEKLKKAFDSADKNYVIYVLPIKFFKKYTIALDCSEGTEICCSFYDNYLEDFPESLVLTEAQAELPPVNAAQFIANRTYKNFPLLRFNNPIVWEGITTKTLEVILEDCLANSVKYASSLSLEEKKHRYKQRILNKESILKLFIKIPIQNQTSITILEGDYHDFNNMKYVPEKKTKVYKQTVSENINGEIVNTEQELVYTYTEWVKKQNHFVTNYETSLISEDLSAEFGTVTQKLPEVEDRPFRPISPLQLLMLNTKTSYPFADRLIEYLTGNVITEWDDNTDNIRRTQKVMELNNNSFTLKGAWEGKMRNILYDYMMNGKPSGEQFASTINHDILGYVDKDVEKFYTAWNLEYCLDENGNRIRLTEIINGERVPIFGLAPKMLLEANNELLLDNRKFILTTNDMGTIPLYKQRYVPLGNISNIDIYNEEE